MTRLCSRLRGFGKPAGRSFTVDPFLMRRISGMLFIIDAEWELSQPEAELLASMMQGN